MGAIVRNMVYSPFTYIGHQIGIATGYTRQVECGAIHFFSRFLAIGGALFGAQSAFALPGDTQTQIVNPGLVTNRSSLDFGSVITGSVQSRIRIPPTSDTIIVSAGNAIPIGGSVSRAQFDVTAAPLTLVLINLPSGIQLTRISGSEQMLLDQFQQNGLPLRFMGASGQLTFFVGGRLRVGPSQAPGLYQGNFTVTVNFL